MWGQSAQWALLADPPPTHTPHSAPRLVQAMPDWSVQTQHALTQAL